MAIAFDLDGTLAEYHGWKGHEHIGDIIPNVKDMIIDLLAKGEEVVIFTARAASQHEKEIVVKWLTDNGLPGLEVTNIKEKHFKFFYDDRAIQVERNTGRVIEDVVFENSRVPEILISASKTFAERGKVYGCAYKNFHGSAMMSFLPDGIELRTEKDFNRFAALNAIIAKLGRYCNNWDEGGHKDSVHDIINFAAMLEEFCDEDS